MKNLDSQQTILFISHGFYYLFKNNSNQFSSKGKLEELKTIEAQNTTAYIDSEYFNLIPKSLYDESSINNYLDLTTTELKGNTPISNDLNSIDAKIIWTLDEGIKKAIILKSPGVIFKHLIELFISEPLNQQRFPEIKIRGSKNTIYILCFIDGVLQLSNRFAITSDDDIIYYTLLCTEHTKLDRENALLSIKGINNTTIFKKLSSFFREKNITIEDNTSNFQSYLP